MLRLDAHQHFWRFNPQRDAWINEDMKMLQRDFMPADLLPELVKSGIDGTVAVQADQSDAENRFLMSLAAENPFIKGIVGWVDLQAEDISEQLQELSRHSIIKGFRHVLQSEPDDAFMLRPAFQRGISRLRDYQFTYDILIYPRHLKHARTLVESHPDQRFVIDHLAKPEIRDHRIADWKKDIEAIARCENVWCKVSGMVTEASWDNWTKTQLMPYLETIFTAFGTRRILFGSDWPVCLLAASYEDVLGILTDYLGGFSADEKAHCLGGNAAAFYQIT